MFAFYISDDFWNQGEEIVSEIMQDPDDDNDRLQSIEKTPLSEVINKDSKRMLYVYDFMLMWTFFIELIEEKEGKLDHAITVFEYGETPKEAPDKLKIESDQDDLMIEAEEDALSMFGLESYDDMDDFEELADPDDDDYSDY